MVSPKNRRRSHHCVLMHKFRNAPVKQLFDSEAYDDHQGEARMRRPQWVARGTLNAVMLSSDSPLLVILGDATRRRPQLR